MIVGEGGKQTGFVNEHSQARSLDGDGTGLHVHGGSAAENRDRDDAQHLTDGRTATRMLDMRFERALVDAGTN